MAQHVIAQDLSAILTKFSVPDRFREFLRSNGVTTVEKLAYLTPEEKTITSDIIEPAATDPPLAFADKASVSLVVGCMQVSSGSRFLGRGLRKSDGGLPPPGRELMRLRWFHTVSSLPGGGW